MHYIGVISDTHGLLRKEVEKELRAKAVSSAYYYGSHRGIRDRGI